MDGDVSEMENKLGRGPLDWTARRGNRGHLTFLETYKREENYFLSNGDPCFAASHLEGENSVLKVGSETKGNDWCLAERARQNLLGGGSRASRAP